MTSIQCLRCGRADAFRVVQHAGLDRRPIRYCLPVYGGCGRGERLGDWQPALPGMEAVAG